MPFADERVSGSARTWIPTLQAVALLHRPVVRVDLAHPVVAQALVDLVEMRADQFLLRLGDAPSVRLTGVLERGVVDLGAAGPGTAAARAIRATGTAAVLGDQCVLYGAVHHAGPGEQVEVLEGHRQALALARAGADPFHGDVTGGGVVKWLDLVGERLEGDRKIGVFRVLVDDKAPEGVRFRLLARDVRDVDGLDCHQGGFLLDQIGFVLRRDANRKACRQATWMSGSYATRLSCR